jgi:hypothetical protein
LALLKRKGKQMEKVKLIKDWFMSLEKKTKIIIAVGIVVIIGIIIN